MFYPAFSITSEHRFIDNPQLNYLIDLKISIVKYLQRMFKLLSYQSLDRGFYRNNSLADVARVWFLLLKPWDSKNAFIECATSLQENEYLISPEKDLNFEMIKLLSDYSISSTRLKLEDKKAIPPKAWSGYARNMSIIYIDLLCHFLKEMASMNNFTAEDVIVFRELAGKPIFMLLHVY